MHRSALVLALSTAALACAQEAASPAPDARPNVLLVTLDTFRADELAPWGAGGFAPRLDQLAAESLVAMDAHAPAPITCPSHASMMTGLYPFAHGIRDNDLYRLDPAAPTAAKLLRDAGWRTEAIVAATVLRSGMGLSNGFERYQDVAFVRARNVVKNSRRYANEVSDLALERLAVADPRPWFLWLHYFDTHQPYTTPDGKPRAGAMKVQYDASAAFIDEQLGRVIDELRWSGALARTWIVVCGDHGEGLGIQQEVTHSCLAEEGTLRIPLFVRRPDGELRGRLAAPTSAVDVYPTLLAIGGLGRPEAIHGVDLVAAFDAEQKGGAAADALADRALWFETWAGWHAMGWARLEGVIAGGFKYVRNVKDELFDVRDPAAADLEKKNLAEERPEVVRALKQRWSALPAEPTARFDSSTSSLPPEEVSRLLEFGYLARSVGSDDTAENGTLDPREHYTTFTSLEWALEKAAEGKIDDAAKVMRQLIKKYPESARFRDDLGKVLMQGKRKEEAEAAFRSALALDPDLVASNFYLGVILRERRQYEEARRLLQKTIDLSPVHLEAWTQIRALHDTMREYGPVLLDTVEVVKLSSAIGDADGDAIARDCVEQWLPNVLARMKDDPRRPALVAQALERLPEEAAKTPFLERARAILVAAK